jgi:hypothetical protein
MPSCKILIIFLFFGIILINLGYVTSQADISLSVDVYPKSLVASAGDEILLQINLVQLLDQKRKDVVLSLSLVDINNKSIYESRQSIALETQASIVERLNLPDNIEEGNYNINIEVFDVNEENLLGWASKEIVVANKITREDIYLIGIYLIAIFLVVLVAMTYKHNRDFHRDHKQRITKRDIVKYMDHEEN